MLCHSRTRILKLKTYCCKNMNFYSETDARTNASNAARTNSRNAAPNLQLLRDQLKMLPAATPADVKEFPNCYLCQVEMPGLNVEDIWISMLVHNQLLVTGMRQRAMNDGGIYMVMGKRIAHYVQKFILPYDANANQIFAEYNKGVVSVTIHKLAPSPALFTRIQIQDASETDTRTNSRNAAPNLQSQMSMLGGQLNVKEFPFWYGYQMDMSRFNLEGISTSVDQYNQLLVTGERQRDMNDGGVYMFKGKRVTNFVQNFILPNDANANQISAEYCKGVLSVTIQKLAPSPALFTGIQIQDASETDAQNLQSQISILEDQLTPMTAIDASSPVDVKEFPNCYVYQMDMPGLNLEHISTSVEQHSQLLVTGERQRDMNDGGIHMIVGKTVAKFEQKFILPNDADTKQIFTAYDKGVLSVTIQKLPPAALFKRIQIQVVSPDPAPAAQIPVVFPAPTPAPAPAPAPQIPVVFPAPPPAPPPAPAAQIPFVFPAPPPAPPPAPAAQIPVVFPAPPPAPPPAPAAQIPVVFPAPPPVAQIPVVFPAPPPAQPPAPAAQIQVVSPAPAPAPQIQVVSPAPSPPPYFF